MASLHIRAGRGRTDMRGPLSPIFELETDNAAMPAKWEAITNEVWSPIRSSRPHRRALKFGPTNLLSRFPATIDERAEHEFMPIPFPRTEPDLIDLTEEDDRPLVPEPRMGLRKRTRTPTLFVVEFPAEEEEEEEEEPANAEACEAVLEAESEISLEDATFHPFPSMETDAGVDIDLDLPEIPAGYASNLLDEELPTEDLKFDPLDDDPFENDADNVASRIWNFALPFSPIDEEPTTPPTLSRPLASTSPTDRSFARSPSPLSLPPSSASLSFSSSLSSPSSPSSSSGSRSLSPSTPPSLSPTPHVSRLPRLSRSQSPSKSRSKSPTEVNSTPFDSNSEIRMSWTGMPSNLFDSFLGAEKEYRRLRSIVDSPSLFEEEMYDSDATVRASDFSTSRRKRSSRHERDESRLRWV